MGREPERWQERGTFGSHNTWIVKTEFVHRVRNSAWARLIITSQKRKLLFWVSCTRMCAVGALARIGEIGAPGLLIALPLALLEGVLCPIACAT